MLEFKLPFHIVKIVHNWYSKTSTQVRWNKCLSKLVNFVSGMQQGSVLSPVLFSLYVDNLLKHLEFCKFGCYIGHRCVNSFMYADAIVLVSISIV